MKAVSTMPKFINQENVLALVICLIAILLWIVTSDSTPQFIYQGF